MSATDGTTDGPRDAERRDTPESDTPGGGPPESPTPDGDTPESRTPEDSTPSGDSTTSGDSTPEGSRTTSRPRVRWRNSHYTPEEQEAARQQLRDILPWDGPMSRGDKVIVFSLLGILALMLLSLPLRPFLLASHPLVLSAVTGSLSAIGAGAAFARIGEAELWAVVLAGVFGMIKFDWLFWLAGRRWGEKGIRFFTPGPTAQRFVAKLRGWPTWVLALAVVAAALPGIPAPVVFLLAGLAGMRLGTFLVFDALGAALITGLVAGLGYGLGQYAVDVVLTIDRYALWISLAIALFIAFQAGRAGNRQAKAGARTADRAPEPTGDA